MLTYESREILFWTFIHRTAVLAILFITAAIQTPFDTSAWLLLQLDSTASSFFDFFSLALTRWDALHFLSQASPRSLPLAKSGTTLGLSPQSAVGGGLQYDYSFAFQPGIIWLLRLLGYRRSSGVNEEFWSPSQAIVLTSLLATTISLFLPLILYNVTLQLSHRKRFARLSALLSILSPSPCTLLTPTPEPFYAFFALIGHFASLSSNKHPIVSNLLASLCFAIATAFRSNGILLAGFLLWSSIWQGSRKHFPFSHLYAAMLGLACLLPLLSTQYFAWTRFCTIADTQSSWCHGNMPSIYAFAQDRYWNVGPFRYWKIDQLPNWLMAMPAMLLTGYWLSSVYCKDFFSILQQTVNPEEARRQPRDKTALLAHAHHTMISLLLLTLTSHVQIVLRFATPGGLPALWWGAALLVEKDQSFKQKHSTTFYWSQILISYLVLWNVASIALFAGFYPPA